MCLKRLYCVLFAICFSLLISCQAFASERNSVINKINSEYYTNDLEFVIHQISKVYTFQSDEQYLLEIFDCLDEYSQYYTSEDVEQKIIYDNTNMISAEFYKGKIVIKINRFGDGVENIFSEYMSKCKMEEIKKLILDLTECPGGYVHVMNSIANEIMPKGKVMTAKFRNNEQVYYSELEKCPFNEIIVKVSSQTASAAEILAAGLQEAGVAKVVGVNTYGKTSIQSFHRLESGAAFKLTCGEYLTRNGNDISKTGVIPDIVDYSYPVKIRWNDYCKEVFRNNKAVSE